MKRILMFILVILLIVSLAGCTEAKTIIDVVTVTEYDRSYYWDLYQEANRDPDADTWIYYDSYAESINANPDASDKEMKIGQKHYYTVSDSDVDIGFFQSEKPIDSFEPDNITIYTIVPGGIIDKHEDGIDRYAAVDKRLYDEKGNVIDMTDTLSEVFDSILDLEPHYIDLGQIFQDGDEYYVYLELNVNWTIPCELYHYDKDRRNLHLVCEFNDERIIGIRVPD